MALKIPKPALADNANAAQNNTQPTKAAENKLSCRNRLRLKKGAKPSMKLLF
jgi:hypothetical protein